MNFWGRLQTQAIVSRQELIEVSVKKGSGSDNGGSKEKGEKKTVPSKLLM